MGDPVIIGVCGLCGRQVENDNPHGDVCSVSSTGCHPRSEVRWSAVISWNAQAPAAWWCEVLCGKAICQEINGCANQHIDAARIWYRKARRAVR